MCRAGIHAKALISCLEFSNQVDVSILLLAHSGENSTADDRLSGGAMRPIESELRQVHDIFWSVKSHHETCNVDTNQHFSRVALIGANSHDHAVAPHREKQPLRSLIVLTKSKGLPHLLAWVKSPDDAVSFNFNNRNGPVRIQTNLGLTSSEVAPRPFRDQGIHDE